MNLHRFGNDVGSTVHGMGSGLHKYANIENIHTPFQPVNETIHPIRTGFSVLDGLTAGIGTGLSDYGLQSYCPGMLIDMHKGERFAKREMRKPGFKRLKKDAKKDFNVNKIKHSDLDEHWHHLEKTGNWRDLKATKKARRARAKGESRLQAMTGINISQAYLKQRSRQKSKALSGGKALDGPSA